MTKENRPPRTFVELVLQLLEDRFPWLGKTTDEQISGADILDQLTDLHGNSRAGAGPIDGMVRKARTSFQPTDGSSLHFEVSLPTRNDQ